MRTIAVTIDDHNLAREYIERNDWAVDAMSIAGAPVGTPEAQLARITPWVYIFRPDGTLAFDDQGQHLASLVSLVPIE